MNTQKGIVYIGRANQTMEVVNSDGTVRVFREVFVDNTPEVVEVMKNPKERESYYALNGFVKVGTIKEVKA